MNKLCIEKKLMDEIDIDTIVSGFASKNFTRKFVGKLYKLFYINIGFWMHLSNY